jgi:hypothetical protein
MPGETFIMANDPIRNDRSSTNDKSNTTDATIADNARPSTDDSVVEGIDEANPGVTGSPRPDAVPASKSNAAPSKDSKSDKAA